MSFFPTYKDNWTRTPNVFYDVILQDPTATLNQVRLVGHLIRQTIGYNREAKWAAVSRKELIEKAKIPNSRIKEAIAGCEKKGWILTFEQGENGKQERYIFLNDPLNVRIVQGLEKGCFSVKDLEYLNLAGINKLLEKHGLVPTPTETGEERTFPPTETGGVPSTETGGVNEASAQPDQEVSAPLNTSFKDNHKKQTNQDCLIDKKVEQEATAFINFALQKGMNVQSKNATKKRYLEARTKGIKPEQIQSTLEATFKRYGKSTSPISVIQTVIDNHVAAEEAAKAAAEEAKEREARRNEYKELEKAAFIAAGIERSN